MRMALRNKVGFFILSPEICGQVLTLPEKASASLSALFYIGKEIQYIRRARFEVAQLALPLKDDRWVSSVTAGNQQASYDQSQNPCPALIKRRRYI